MFTFPSNLFDKSAKILTVLVYEFMRLFKADSFYRVQIIASWEDTCDQKRVYVKFGEIQFLNQGKIIQVNLEALARFVHLEEAYFDSECQQVWIFCDNCMDSLSKVHVCKLSIRLIRSDVVLNT